MNLNVCGIAELPYQLSSLQLDKVPKQMWHQKIVLCAKAATDWDLMGGIFEKRACISEAFLTYQWDFKPFPLRGVHHQILWKMSMSTLKKRKHNSRPFPVPTMPPMQFFNRPIVPHEHYLKGSCISAENTSYKGIRLKCL